MSRAKKRAAKVAEQLLDKLGLDSAPIDVEDIAKRLGIRVLPTPESDAELSGFLFRDNSQVIIGVNSSDITERQRFTIAHELGHYFLHDNVGVRVDVKYRNARTSLGVDLEEIEANAFAAELLMPASLIKDDMDRCAHVELIHDAEIERLSQKYKVSLQAITIRLSNLGYLEL